MGASGEMRRIRAYMIDRDLVSRGFPVVTFFFLLFFVSHSFSYKLFISLRAWKTFFPILF
jgi:hypothetical protein